MNCLLVLNTGGVMCENSRHSFTDAAKRWGCDYVEATVNRFPWLDPTFSKCAAISCLHGYDRVAYYDSDILIRSDAPSVFDEHNDHEAFYAVADIAAPKPHLPQDAWPTLVEEVRGKYHPMLQAATGATIPKQLFIDRFFNAGFFILSPSCHEDVLTFFSDHNIGESHPHRRNGHYEQALFNFAVQLLHSDRLVLCDETWNYIDPNVATGTMDHYVYHFTGISKGQIRPALAGMNWRV